MSEDQANKDDLELEDFSENVSNNAETADANTGPKQVEDLQAVYDVPVKISAVLGRTNLEIADLLDLDEGDVKLGDLNEPSIHSEKSEILRFQVS